MKKSLKELKRLKNIIRMLKTNKKIMTQKLKKWHKKLNQPQWCLRNVKKECNFIKIIKHFSRLFLINVKCIYLALIIFILSLLEYYGSKVLRKYR